MYSPVGTANGQKIKEKKTEHKKVGKKGITQVLWFAGSLFFLKLVLNCKNPDRIRSVWVTAGMAREPVWGHIFNACSYLLTILSQFHR